MPVIRFCNEEMMAAGLESLNWWLRVQHCEIKGHFVPIGSKGFYSQEYREGALRPATCGSLRDCLRLLAGVSRNGKGPLAQGSVVGVQLVPG